MQVMAPALLFLLCAIAATAMLAWRDGSRPSWEAAILIVALIAVTIAEVVR